MTSGTKQTNTHSKESVDGFFSAFLTEDLAPLFWRPELLDKPSAWFGHIPFAHWLIRVHKPRTLVELGTHAGVSYSAFCAAAVKTGLDARYFAVDTWKGDDQAGHFPEQVFEEFKRFHDERFSSFSTLIRCTFDQALDHFQDASIDLLHIDGFHSYDAVRHDFETWFPKLSRRAIVLFHDANERREGFGVWRLWEELRDRYPSFEWLHSHGLGVLLVGEDAAEPVAQLCRFGASETAVLQERMAFLGERWAMGAAWLRTHGDAEDQKQALRQAELQAEELRGRLDAETAETARAKSTIRALLNERDHMMRTVNELRRDAKDQAQALRDARVQAQALREPLDADTAETGKALGSVQDLLDEQERMMRTINELRRAVEQHTEALHQAKVRAREEIDNLEEEVKRRNEQVNEILASSSWRVTAPLRRVVSVLRR